MRSALIVVLSSVVGTGFNLLYSKGIDPFRPLPPSASSHGRGATQGSQGAYTPSSQFVHISLEEAYERFETGAALFVDARMDKEYVKSRIPGALHLPPQAFEKGRPDVMDFIAADASVEVVLYCNADDCPLAEETARHLIEYGITNFVIFTGGWDEWVAAGHPIDEGAP